MRRVKSEIKMEFKSRNLIVIGLFVLVASIESVKGFESDDDTKYIFETPDFYDFMRDYYC